MRAHEVITGVACILCLWAWAITSFKPNPNMIYTVALLVSRVWIACIITACVYREYLK